MTGGPGLEDGYRRLLAWYPRRFRQEHGEELLAVLLASARDGQQRPGLIESADLVRNGLWLRLRPDNSQSARQGWSDALAAYSLVGPVLLLAVTIAAAVLYSLWLALQGRRYLSNPNYHPWYAVMAHVLPSLGITLGVEALIVVLVLSGKRKTALAVTVPTLASLWLAAVRGFPAVDLVLLFVTSVYLLEVAALIALPGPQCGRPLPHWGHWAVALIAGVATQAFFTWSGRESGGLAALTIMVVVMLALARAGRKLRLSRYFLLLLAATVYPTVVLPAARDLGGLLFLAGLGLPGSLALYFAGPLLCAAVAMISAIRPRRRRII